LNHDFQNKIKELKNSQIKLSHPIQNNLKEINNMKETEILIHENEKLTKEKEKIQLINQNQVNQINEFQDQIKSFNNTKYIIQQKEEEFHNLKTQFKNEILLSNEMKLQIENLEQSNNNYQNKTKEL
jgi:hypothetical protein